MTRTTFNLSSLADKALDAFWQIITARFPDAKIGDLSIDLTIRLSMIAEAAIEEWIFNNVPDNSCPDERRHDES